MVDRQLFACGLRQLHAGTFLGPAASHLIVDRRKIFAGDGPDFTLVRSRIWGWAVLQFFAEGWPLFFCGWFIVYASGWSPLFVSSWLRLFGVGWPLVFCWWLASGFLLVAGSWIFAGELLQCFAISCELFAPVICSHFARICNQPFDSGYRPSLWLVGGPKLFYSLRTSNLLVVCASYIQAP